MTFHFSQGLLASDDKYEFVKGLTPSLSSSDLLQTETTQLDFSSEDKRFVNSTGPKVRVYGDDGKRIKWKFVKTMIR